jgi:hypothetical protein
MAFIDKINPDLPEGRLLIRNGEFILKYPDAEVSKVPLDKKWEKLLKYNRTRNKAGKRANNRETVFPKFRKSTRHRSGRSNRRKNSTSPGRKAGVLEWVCNLQIHACMRYVYHPPCCLVIVCRCTKPPASYRRRLECITYRLF